MRASRPGPASGCASSVPQGVQHQCRYAVDCRGMVRLDYDHNVENQLFGWDNKYVVMMDENIDGIDT